MTSVRTRGPRPTRPCERCGRRVETRSNVENYRVRFCMDCHRVDQALYLKWTTEPAKELEVSE